MITKTKTIAVINETKILVVENGQKLVPIKPICEALGIATNMQIEKIKSDEILGPTSMLSISVGGDGKEREMFCLPFRFVFGWLFTINPSNVKEEAREAVIRYKLTCYEALFQSFTDTQEFLKAKQVLVEKKLIELEKITNNFKSTKNLMYDKKKELNKVRSLTLEDWLANDRQMDLFEGGKEENNG